MSYCCKSCGKSFDWDGEISFCPYCGVNLFQKRAKSVADVIDAVWGETAVKKKEYLVTVFGTIDHLKHLFQEDLEDFYHKYRDDVKKWSYREAMKIISRCDTKKAVLSQTEKLIKKIQEKISQAEEYIDVTEPISFSGEKQRIYKKYGEALLAELDMPFTEVITNGIVVHKTIYSKDRLEIFLKQVKIAYEKYVRCVNQNDIFSAFPADSSFGNIGRRAYATESDIFENDDFLQNIEEEKFDFERELDLLCEANQQPYHGYLDEEYVTYVEVFWRGVKVLLSFLCENDFGEITEPSIIFDDKFTQKMRSKILKDEFIITDEKMERIQEISESMQQEMDY